MKTTTSTRILAIGLCLGALAACGGSGGGGGGGSSTPPATYTIGGTVSGLDTGTEVVLQDNGGDNLTVSANGTFAFPTALASGAAYAVTVLTPPTGESCAPSGASGTVASANVTSVSIVCTVTPTYTIGGTASGLGTGAKVVLENNGGDVLDVSANGAFKFTTALAGGGAYAVTILTQPAGETCTLSGASGTVGAADVTSVAVACAATVVSKYTIGGTVTGLNTGAEAVLEDNGGDNLTVSADGAFTFTAALAGGATYAVTLLTQPAGETCTLSGASGTVGSADITGVAVACTSSGGGGGGGSAPGFWMPFSATPVSGTSGGSVGLFLIASNQIAGPTAPPMEFVTASEPTILGLAFQGYLGATTPPSSATPATMIYAAAGADGNTHMYGLNLANPSNSTTPPTPVQISSLSVPPSKSLCGIGQSQSDATMPNTLSVIVYEATPESGTKPGEEGYCEGVAGGTYYWATYTNSASTAPTVATIPGGTSSLSATLNDGIFLPLNQRSGLLGGLLYWDSATNDENFYATPAFASSTTLLSGVRGIPVACVDVTAVINGESNYIGGNNLEVISTSAGMTSYEISASGTVTPFFAGDASQCITDSANLYFIGTPTSNTSTQAIYQDSLTSLSTMKTLFDLPAPTATTIPNLVGSNGSLVVFQEYTIGSGGTETTKISTVPVGSTSASATVIAGPYQGLLSSDFLLAPSAAAATDVLFLTERNGTTTVTYTSQALDPSGAGSVLQTSANSIWQSFGAFTGELEGDILQVKGITDTNGAYGGATLELVSVGSLNSPTAMTTTGGASYTVPTGYQFSFTGYYGTSVAVGSLFSTRGAAQMGAAVDVSHHTIVPLSLDNTNIVPML